MAALQSVLQIDAPNSAAAVGETAGGSARVALHQRFAARLVVRHDLNRRLVSYQANKAQPGLRWLKYKEGFSADLVR